VRERGYAVNYGETSREEVAVAAEMLDHRSDVVACAMIAAPFYRVGSSELEELSSAAVTAARKISQRLGYQSNNR
jgi:DNA-binding IclR family transcriptional regulator